MEIGVLLEILFASRVARHDKSAPPKIAGVKCLFFLLVKKNAAGILDAGKDLRTVWQISIDTLLLSC